MTVVYKTAWWLWHLHSQHAFPPYSIVSLPSWFFYFSSFSPLLPLYLPFPPLPLPLPSSFFVQASGFFFGDGLATSLSNSSPESKFTPSRNMPAMKKHLCNDIKMLLCKISIAITNTVITTNSMHLHTVLTHACVYTIETKIKSNLNVHNRMRTQLHLIKLTLCGSFRRIWIYVRSGLSMIVREAISSITMMNVVCVLLLASAATKQPPLVTKLSLTSNRHFNWKLEGARAPGAPPSSSYA